MIMIELWRKALISCAAMLMVGLMTTGKPAHAADLLETLTSQPNFKILKLVLEASGIHDTLKNKGPHTLFAPNDNAFGKLPAGTIEALLQPENKAMLRSIVGYHVLPGKTLKAWRIIEVRNFDIKTLEGSRAEIDTKSGLSIENAAITQADILADNGVIHVIDAVMLPPKVKRAIKRRR